MNRKGYAFVVVVFGILLHHTRKLNAVSSAVRGILEADYQAEVDDIFEEIVEEQLGDLE